MLEGLEDEELECYLDENLRTAPLFDIDVGGTTETYASPVANAVHNKEPNEEAIMELCRAQDAFMREMEISHRVMETMLEEINVGSAEAPHALSVAKNFPPTERETMIKLLQEYNDIFA